MKYDSKEMMLTFLSPDAEMQSNAFTIQERIKIAATTIKGYADNWGDMRRELEMEWLDCWAEYFSNHRAAEHLRTSSLQVTGQTMASMGKGWRHKITTGKAFELVETVNSYLQGAFFPNRQWFDMYPKSPMYNEEWESVLNVLTHYFLYKLDESQFKRYWDIFIRQVLICGTSVLALPWRYDAIMTYKNRPKTVDGKVQYVPTEHLKVTQNGFDFEVVDMFDFYLDPSCNDRKKANCIRRIVKRKGEVMRLIEQGVYPLGDKEMVAQANAYSPSSRSSANKENITYMTGLDTVYQYHNQLVELYEFWGDLQIGDYEFVDVCATVLDGNLLSIMPNPYWGGRPFVIGSLIDVHDTPYGIGLLQPVLGQLHGLFECSNHRMDVDELTINPVLFVINDGSIDLNQLYVSPGKIIPVEDPENAVTPLELPNTTQVTVQDETILEQRIDKATGVGSYVGVNSGRHAERVTAEEINAQKDAGGNRLGGYHAHLEGTAMLDFLTKSYQYLQQFVINDEVIRVKKQVKDSFKEQYDYFSVGQDDLQYDMDIIPVGSDYIVNKEYELQQRLDFYTFISQYPETSKYINWKEAIKDLARRFLKQDWERFIMMPDEQNATVPGEEELMVQQQQAMPPEMQGQQPMPPEGAMPPVGGGQGDLPLETQMLADQMTANPEQMMESIRRQQEIQGNA